MSRPDVPLRQILRQLVEWGTVALCLWTAVYHTPLGALVRGVSAWVVGRSGESRGLLSYYSGGVTPEVVLAPVRASALPSDVSALAAGAFSSYRAAPARVQAGARSTLMSLGANIQRLDDPSRGPRELEKALNRLRHDGHEEPAALLAIFAGVDAARFAEGRARAEGRGLGPDDLARQLPPGYEAALSATAAALAYAVAPALSWPARSDARVTSGFGWRLHPVNGERKLHKGVDLGLAVGTPVWATAPGVVTRSSYDHYNGHIIVVAHAHGVRSLYLHNSARLVSVGDRVERGATLARSGQTGIATGPHLHYQLEIFSRAVDPESFRR